MKSQKYRDMPSSLWRLPLLRRQTLLTFPHQGSLLPCQSPSYRTIEQDIALEGVIALGNFVFIQDGRYPGGNRFAFFQ